MRPEQNDADTSVKIEIDNADRDRDQDRDWDRAIQEDAEWDGDLEWKYNPLAEGIANLN